MRLAIDIGGTFTDIVLEDNPNLFTKKVLTSTAQPEVAVIEGVVELLQENKIKSSDIKMIIHGTTLATNAVIERKGAKTCFITILSNIKKKKGNAAFVTFSISLPVIP